MTTWYVRPDTSHNTVRDGQSYATAWGGYSEIVYGGAGIHGGDTLYICGTHILSSIFRVYNCAGTSGSRTYIRGDLSYDPGTIRFNSGSYFLQTEVAYCTIKGLTIYAGVDNCIFTLGAASNCIYEDNKLIANVKPAIAFYAINGQNYSDITIRRNVITGNSLVSAGLGAAIAWFLFDTAAISTCTRISIENNTFLNFDSGRSVIHFRTEPDTDVTSRMKDMKCNENTFINCSGRAIEFQHGHEQKFVGEGIQCLRNKIYDNRETLLLAGSGGGIVLLGFAHSTTSGFGLNKIANNYMKNVAGANGAFNVFYGSYIIEDNVVDGLTTTTIDGNGLLFDHGSDGCIARRNTFKNIYGKSGVFNSGYGVMFLDAVRCDVYGNTFENIHYGVHASGATSFTLAQQFNCYNNTFTNISVGGCYITTTADKTQALVKNNIFTGLSGSAAVICPTTGGWTGEALNCFYGFDVANTNHTLNVGDVTTNPNIGVYLKLNSSSPCIAKGVFVGNYQDKLWSSFQNPPSIGAYEYMRPRVALTQVRTFRN